MGNSIIMDPNHVPQKKNKVIKELPNGRLIPKEMQKMSGKGWFEVKDEEMHNLFIDILERVDENEGAFLEHEDLSLYLLGNCVLLLEENTNTLFATKESPLEELNPVYWEKLSKICS